MRDRESIGGLLKNRREKKWDKKQRVNKTREGEEEGERERDEKKSRATKVASHAMVHGQTRTNWQRGIFIFNNIDVAILDVHFVTVLIHQRPANLYATRN